jgi:hypothetical protein
MMARIVVGMNEHALPFGNNGVDAVLAFGQCFALQNDLGAKGLGRLDLHERRRDWHHDGGRNTEAARVIGDSLGMVAGRHRDDAAAPFVLAESGEFHERAAVLERIGHLQVLVLDENLGAGEARELRRSQHRGA